MYGSWEGEKSKRNASRWKVCPGGQVHKSLSLSKSKLCVRNQSTPHQLDRWRERSYLLTLLRPESAQKFILSLHHLLLGSNWNSLSHTLSIYFYVHLSQCNLSDVKVAQQQQNVYFPVLWGIHSPGHRNSLLSSGLDSQSIPTPTQRSFVGFYHPAVLSQPEKKSAFGHEEKRNLWPSLKEAQGAVQSWARRKPLVAEGFAFQYGLD